MSGVPNAFEQGGGMTNPMTTQGDIIIENATPAPARLAVGSANQVLTVSGGLPSWQNSVAGFSNPMTTAGDLLYENATPAAARLPIGSNGNILTVAAGLPSWGSPVLAPAGATTVAASAITTTALTDIGPTYTVPANTAASGVGYEIYVLLNLTAAGTAGSNTATVSFYWGGTGGTQLATMSVLNSAGSVSNIAGYITIQGYVRFTSVSACSSQFVWSFAAPVTGTGNSPVASGSNIANIGALTTNANKVLTCAWQYSAVVGGPSITPEYARVSRVS